MAGAVLVSRAQLDSVKSALDAVKSNGQALAAIDSSLGAAKKLQVALWAEGGPIRQGAIKDIADAAAKLDAPRRAFAGLPTQPVAQASWLDARQKLTYMWTMVFLVEKGLPPGQELGDGWKSALAASVRDLPTTIGNAAGVALKTVVKVTTEVAK